MNLSFSSLITEIKSSQFSKVFDWDWHSDRNFFKQFFAGAFIAIVMTGLDQDMMQKKPHLPKSKRCTKKYVLV
jgi:SSS family solute:Na+ symporter